MAEGARLESVYRLIAYLGFESPSLRQDINAKRSPQGGLFAFILWRREVERLRAPRGDSKAVGLLAAAGSRDVTESPSLRQDINAERSP